MEITIKVIIGIIALFHLYVMWLEMFAWTSKGPRTFKNFDKELFPKTKSLAANQGLYNGFLAAGLIWSICISNREFHFQVSMFFLICVSIAGIYGALTADKKIFYVQALPALVGITLLSFSAARLEVTIYQEEQENNKEANGNSIAYYYLPNDGRGETDTVQPAEILQRNDKDSLIGMGFIEVMTTLCNPQVLGNHSFLNSYFVNFLNCD